MTDGFILFNFHPIPSGHTTSGQRCYNFVLTLWRPYDVVLMSRTGWIIVRDTYRTLQVLTWKQYVEVLWCEQLHLKTRIQQTIIISVLTANVNDMTPWSLQTAVTPDTLWKEIWHFRVRAWNFLQNGIQNFELQSQSLHRMPCTGYIAS